MLEAVKKRQIGLYAVLSEGRPESLDDDTLVIKFPAGYRFQADMVARGDNPRVITEALREVTDKRPQGRRHEWPCRSSPSRSRRRKMLES